MRCTRSAKTLEDLKGHAVHRQVGQGFPGRLVVADPLHEEVWNAVAGLFVKDGFDVEVFLVCSACNELEAGGRNFRWM